MDRMRLLAKFVESDYAKVDKLLEIRESTFSRLKSIDAEIETEKKVRLIVLTLRIIVPNRSGDICRNCSPKMA